MRLSAGIPREFIRALQKGFEFAALRKMPRVTLDLLKAAELELRRQLIYSTQTSDVRKRLMDVQRTSRLGDSCSLLSSLLVVELTNEKPWYAVHPLLDGEVGEWILETDAKAGADAEAKAQSAS